MLKIFKYQENRWDTIKIRRNKIIRQNIKLKIYGH